MIRILILILAFNAFFTSASAKSMCSMPMESGSKSLMQSSDHCAEMSQETKAPCCSLDCSFDCSYHFSPFSISNETIAKPIIALAGQPQNILPHFYNIILPIKTPPPLV